MGSIWPPRDGARRYLLVGALLLVLGGLALRVATLDEQGYWHDEIYSVAFLTGFDAYVLPGSDLDPAEPARPAASWVQDLRQDRFTENLARNLVHEGHPPLYYLGLKGWTELWGRSPITLRAFSLLAAVLTIPVLYLLGHRMQGPRLGTAAALLLAVSPFHLYYSVEARSYAWSILFAAVALLAMVTLWQRTEAMPSRWLAVWWGAVLGAGYTHYYAGLYCALLLLVFFVLRKRKAGTLLRLGAPFLLFLPWLPTLRAQFRTHSAEHWTVGAPGLAEAALGFGDVALDQLTGVFDSATVAEELLAGGILLVGAWLLVRRRSGSHRPDVRWMFAAAPLYGLAVLGLDLLTNHHTVLVSRYLSSLLPTFVLVAAWLVTARRGVYLLLFALFVMVSLGGSYRTAMGERAPKQMLREAGSYIGERYSPGDVVLVTPSGPSLLGLALYLPPHALVGAVPPDRALTVARRRATEGRTVWLARQNLGAAYELEWPVTTDGKEEAVRFAGLDVVPIPLEAIR